MTAYTPNLPSLIADLSSDASRAPQTEFTRARQVLFLENLSVTGSVRSAAAAAGTSHQTAYRARRSQKGFRLAWDAALVLARTHAEGTLACRAIDGIEEKVFYHGEEVATRTRYSDRLLLAHLARLDRHAADERINAVAEDFDAALARFEAGEDVLAEAPEPADEYGDGEGDLFSPGQCNTRSKSYTTIDDWDEDELAEAMERERPDDAPPLELLGDPEEVADCQRHCFVWGEDDWWRTGESFMPFVRDAAGRWVLDPEELARLASRSDEDGDPPREGEGEGAAEEAAPSAEDPGDLAQPEERPETEPEPAPPPVPEPAPPLDRIAERPSKPRWNGPPVNDGRAQPFVGRPWV